MAPPAASNEAPIHFNEESFQPLPNIQQNVPFSSGAIPRYTGEQYAELPNYSSSEHPVQLQQQSTTKSSGETQRTQIQEDAIDDDMAYDSDPEHAQDWSKKTHPNDSWAIQERRRKSLFGDTEIINPHAPSDKYRRGSILSQYRSTKDTSGNHVISSGFEDHVPVVVEKVEKQGRSMSGTSNGAGAGRRGSVLSMFTNGKDSKGRHVINSGFEEESASERE